MLGEGPGVMFGVYSGDCRAEGGDCGEVAEEGSVLGVGQAVGDGALELVCG